MLDTPPSDPLAPFLGQEVVLDTQGPLIYIGTLTHLAPTFLTLTNANVHDSNDSSTSKELYILESRELGVRINRLSTLIMRNQIASASLLRDIID